MKATVLSARRQLPVYLLVIWVVYIGKGHVTKKRLLRATVHLN